MAERNAVKREYACTCAVCGRSFTAGSPNAKYCSDACRAEARRERDRKRREAERAAKAAAEATAERTAETAAPETGPLPAGSPTEVGAAPEAPVRAYPPEAAPLFPGVMPEAPVPGGARNIPSAAPAPERTAAQTAGHAGKKPVPKERLIGFTRAGEGQRRYVKAAAMKEFMGRAAAWAGVLSFGCAAAVATIASWASVGAGGRAACAAVSVAVCLAGAAGIARNRACMERIRRGRFKILRCEVVRYFAFTKPEARDVLIRTEKGQYCKDAFRVDMSGCRGNGVILVKCAARGRAAFALIKPGPEKG